MTKRPSKDNSCSELPSVINDIFNHLQTYKENAGHDKVQKWSWWTKETVISFEGKDLYEWIILLCITMDITSVTMSKIKIRLIIKICINTLLLLRKICNRRWRQPVGNNLSAVLMFLFLFCLVHPSSFSKPNLFCHLACIERAWLLRLSF